MKLRRILATACTAVALASGVAMAIPTAQTWIPSPDAKGFGEATFNVISIQRFSSKADAGPSYYDAGVTFGVLPLEFLKLELGFDYLTTNFQNDNFADNHPFYFNAKLATPEDLGIKGMPAFAIGAYNLGIADKGDAIGSTRQNIVYGLVGKTFPIVGRISAGGYYGSARALATAGNSALTHNNSGAMVSWDRTISEISDKLWLGVDYMSGNNANGEISFGASWAFSKQITFLAGVQIFNPFYKISASDNGALPGGKPAFTTQLFINLP